MSKLDCILLDKASSIYSSSLHLLPSNFSLTTMSRHHETNPHFLPRQQDPILDFPSQTPPPRSRRSPRRHGRTPVEPTHGRTTPPPPNHGRTPVEQLPHGHPSPPRHYGRAPVEPPPHGRASVTPPPHVRTPPQPSTHYPPTQVKPVPPLHHEVPHQHHQGSRPPFVTESDERGQHGGGAGGRHHDRSFIHTPSRRTKPATWLVAAFCTLFWIIVIVGGLVILIVYLVFRPRGPRFDISTATINAAYLDMGYLLNADMRVLANFTNPNTKVNVEFSYAILDLYYGHTFVATRYIRPFAVLKGQSRFADVHMVASQVRMTTEHSLHLQKEIEQGRVNIEIKGMFRAKSKLGGIFHYSYWMYANCRLVVTGPPTGVLIGKKCDTNG